MCCIWLWISLLYLFWLKSCCYRVQSNINVYLSVLQEEPNEVMAPAERSCWGTSLFMNVMVSFWRKGNQESLECLIHLAITGQQLDVVIAKRCINGYYHMLDETVRKRMAPSRICWMLLVFHRRQWLTGRVGAVGRPETEPVEKPAPLNTLRLQLHWSWTTERSSRQWSNKWAWLLWDWENAGW